MPHNQLTKRKRKQTNHSVKRGGRFQLQRRWITKNPLVSAVSGANMILYWNDIIQNLRTLNYPKSFFSCVCCGAKLQFNAFKYNTVIDLSGTEATTSKKIIVRKYNLPSAMRNSYMPSIPAVVGGNKKRSGGTLFQPTIFYFHCPQCSFLHQFKSSVEKEDMREEKEDKREEKEDKREEKQHNENSSASNESANNNPHRRSSRRRSSHKRLLSRVMPM